eukprot:TRINITY_DN18548_c0_g1_i1.p1 TRINITY_DN18548_c0_g1~~TRINITY_DN18548_c0_g1_i1.p1  ORF type:complete len:119 (-),score=10.90 TRINITY_DN18548_c0_g1_i1:522-878(-)
MYGEFAVDSGSTHPQHFVARLTQQQIAQIHRGAHIHIGASGPQYIHFADGSLLLQAHDVGVQKLYQRHHGHFIPVGDVSAKLTVGEVLTVAPAPSYPEQPEIILEVSHNVHSAGHIHS